jgi:transcriptional regulator with XRE-family HTH domain
MQALAQHLKRNKMSQAALAKAIGVAQPSVWGWLSGDTRPSIDNLVKLSKVTGLPIEKLLGTPRP